MATIRCIQRARCFPLAQSVRLRPKQGLPVAARSYHSHEHDEPVVFNDTEEAILSASIPYIPEHGFSTQSLRSGARDAGYLDVSVNLFPKGAFDLINYHLVTQRLALKHQVQFPEPKDGNKKLGIGAKVRLLTNERLMANRATIHRWPEALAIMAQPTNVQTSVAELARLADEIWFLAGDVSVDTTWYTKRATLSAIYSSTELFMTQDKSKDFIETQEFLDRRLQDVQNAGSAISNVGEWINFTGQSFVNIARSKGLRI